MSMIRFVAGIFSVGLIVLASNVATGQDYPNKPIRIITAGVGGTSDFTARLVAQGLSDAVGQQVVVDNRRSGVIPGQVASKAPPDGYTLFVGSNSFWLQPFLHDIAPYDPVKEFSPITAVARSPSFLSVHPSLPVKSVRELIALAKARPGELNYASGTTGGADHLSAELFKSMTSTNIVRVSYSSGSLRMASLISGEVQLIFGTGGTVMPYIQAGRLRVLAVTSTEPFSLAPELPTVAASGVPGYEALQILGIWAPANTPATIISRLNREIVRAINREEIKEKFERSGVEIVGGSPEKFATMIKADMTKLGKLIKDLGIRTN